jgi:RNA polymerase sigma factor (sigma-70 family)
MHLAPREAEQPRSHETTLPAAADDAAFAELYELHFDPLFDFVVRMVHDRDLAGEVVQASFARAWDELRDGREIRYPKAWLFAVARNRAIDELRGRQRIAAAAPEYAQADPSRLADPQAVAEDKEIVDLVWTSAEALTPDEYSLLDLHVRHGRGPPARAAALARARGAVYTRLSRLRSSLEDSVGSTLLVRSGRDECPELRAIVSEHGGESLTPGLRRAVRAHVQQCDVCGEEQRRLVSPVELFGALVPVMALPGVREGIWGSLASGAAPVAGGTAAAVHAGAGQAAKLRNWVAGSAAAAAVATVLALVLSSGPSVADPERVASPDHDVGVASTDPTVTVRWSTGKNANGYSVIFSRDRSVEPPARVNVTGTQFTSAALAPGRWWFILRTRGNDGHWTSTLWAGPFVIAAEVAGGAAPDAPRAPTRPRGSKTTKRKATAGAEPAPAVAGISPNAPASQTQPGARKKNPAAPRPRGPHAVRPPTKTPVSTPGPKNPAGSPIIGGTETPAQTPQPAIPDPTTPPVTNPPVGPPEQDCQDRNEGHNCTLP